MKYVELPGFYLDNSLLLSSQAENATMTGERGASSNNGGESTGTTEEGTTQSSGGFGGWGSIILLYAVLFGALYFFSIRPNRKKEKQIKEMQASMQVGDDVVTSGGMYGKVVDMDEDKVTVEFGTNKGIRIPIRKSDVFKVLQNTETK